MLFQENNVRHNLHNKVASGGIDMRKMVMGNVNKTNKMLPKSGLTVFTPPQEIIGNLGYYINKLL